MATEYFIFVAKVQTRMTSMLHMIDTTGPGGAETVFLDLVSDSMEKGHDCFALIRGPGWVEDQLKKRKIPYMIFDSKGSFNLSYLSFLIRLIRERNIKLIQAHLFGSGIYAAMAGLVTRVPVVVTIHGMVDVSERERFLWLKTKILNRGTTRIVGVTDQIGSMLRALPNIKSEKVITIYNGISIEKFKTSRSRDDSLNSSSPVKIGCLGNIRIPKNYPLAIRAINKLRDLGIDAELLIAGQGNESQREPLEREIKAAGLEDKVKLLGFVEDTREFLSDLDIFLMSSSSEGHPLALTQAMANGLPIVTTPSGVEEIVEHEKEVLISGKHEDTELAHLIKKLVEDDAYRKKIAKSSQEKAVNVFSETVMFENYTACYQEIIKEKSHELGI